mmetsp:Transcript_33334/g.86507  ORF Transcript_33334/g.86507 Transcript_33334/m.86507 type:complete len:621 (+) Transcript_33334:55-1917(+)
MLRSFASVVLACHAAKTFSEALAGSESEALAACTEPTVAPRCNCDEWSSKYKAYLCSSCKNTTQWGYGCVLDCPAHCAFGCDFSGNCRMNLCPETCKKQKRNPRARAETTRKYGPDSCLNKFGECEACDRGKWGLRCEYDCPGNCGSSPEGPCDRKGNCIGACRTGFFGLQCDQACPEACPKCLKVNSTIDGEFAEAGSCDQACTVNTYGKACDLPCPVNCDAGGKIPSCSRDKGDCPKCVNGWYAPQCDKQCSEGCVGGVCDQATGTCTRGCLSGWYGDGCDKKCPANTKATCNRKTGLPDACNDHFFPGLSETTGEGVCLACPGNCDREMCDPTGRCMGCKNGFTGDTCEVRCSANCVGMCDQVDGTCLDRVVADVKKRPELDKIQRVLSSGKIKKDVEAGDARIPEGAELLDEGDMKGKDKGYVGGLDTSVPYGARLVFRAGPCAIGWTGAKCDVPCHHTCYHCQQFREPKPTDPIRLPGNTPADCVACPDEEPSLLSARFAKAGTCECIDEAERSSEDGKCHCIQPDDEKREARFDKGPPKKCRHPCRRGTTEAFGDDKTAVCLVKTVVRAIFLNEETLDQGSCPTGMYAIYLGDGAPQCIRQDYAKSIVADFGDR